MVKSDYVDNMTDSYAKIKTLKSLKTLEEKSFTLKYECHVSLKMIIFKYAIIYFLNVHIMKSTAIE